MSDLHVEHLSMSFGTHQVLEDLSFHIKSGEIACLLGASGCGKTTALRAIAGFEKPQRGKIVLAGVTLDDAHTQLAAHLRHIGMVFQDYALFPHLTVAQNIAFGLKHHRDKKERSAKMLDLVNLGGHRDHYPHELSGGQQQRVALARALALQPAFILLDEPFSNLDGALRHQLAQEVRDLLKSQGTSALLVTHDKQEAFTTADKIGILHHGRLQQWAEPTTLYQQPASEYVAEFIGEGALLNGTVRTVNGSLHADLGFTALPLPANTWQENRAIRVLLRPHDIHLDSHSPVKTRLLSRDFLGGCWRYTVATADGQKLLLRTEANHCHANDEMLSIRIDANPVIAFMQPSN